MNLPIALHTYSYIWHEDFHATLDRLARFGRPALEALINQPHLWPTDLDSGARSRIAAHVQALGLEIVSLNCPSLDLNLAASAREMRRYSIEHYRDTIDLAADCGIARVCAIPGKVHPLLAAPLDRLHAWLATALEELAAHARERGVDLLIENFPPGFLPRAEDMMDFLDRAAPDVGIVYDVANAVFAGEDPAHGISVCAPRLRLVHLSDTRLDRYGHDDIGSGVVDFAAVARALTQNGYRHPSVLEVISQRVDRADQALSNNLSALAAVGWAP